MGANLTKEETKIYTLVIKEGLGRGESSLRIVWNLRTKYAQERRDMHRMVLIVRRMIKKIKREK